jgi:hypothetical protein
MIQVWPQVLLWLSKDAVKYTQRHALDEGKDVVKP